MEKRSTSVIQREFQLTNLVEEFWDWENELSHRSGWQQYTFNEIIDIVKDIHKEFVKLFGKIKNSLDSKIKEIFKEDLKKMAEILDFCIN